MVPWFEPATIFLGVLGGTALTLVSVYFCVKKGMCFCNVEDGTKTAEDEAEYIPLATEEESITGTSMFSSPAALISESKNKPAALSNPELESLKLSDDEKLDGHNKGKIGGLIRQKSQSLENFSSFPRILLTLQYSRKDMFLIVAIHSIEGLDDRVKTLNNQLRVNTVLLPEKKFRFRTKYVNINNPSFESKFKFSNVSRAALFQSALRFRLYGRIMRLGIQAGRERCLGELTIHLADVAQREDALKTLRPMHLKGSHRK